MALATEQTELPLQERLFRLSRFNELTNTQKLTLLGGIAALMAVIVAVWLYSRSPDYRVLFGAVSEQDGGAIVAALQQQNVPYKLGEGGVILVPANQVHELRLRLAAQGLPKGGALGFELLDNQRLGVSQFQEQVAYLRALQGELARSIMSIDAVQTARVHLNTPKQTVFLRDQQKPSATVVLRLHPGRILDKGQVAAISHLVASSVTDLAPSAVTVIDQNGTLLTGATGSAVQVGLDPSQVEFVQQLEKKYVGRIEHLVAALVGPENVRAQVTAQVDFTQAEQTSETFKPNPQPNDAAIESQQTKESRVFGGTAVGGIPGALSNQPPGAASAPLNAAGRANVPNASGQSTEGQPISTQRESVTNYRVDKTIRHTKEPTGNVKRLSVAVVVNFRKTGEGDKVQYQALSQPEMTQITNLVKEAIGFNQDRNDSVTVTNAAFMRDDTPPVPAWRDPENQRLAKELGVWLVLVALLMYLVFGVLRPLLRNVLFPPEPEAQEGAEEGQMAEGEGEALPEDRVTLGELATDAAEFDLDLKSVKDLAKQDPRLVAEILKSWINAE